MNYPPNSFWILVESDELEALVLNQDSSRIKLALGRWHCLPDRWKSEAVRLEREGRSAYSPVRVKLWPAALSPVHAI